MNLPARLKYLSSVLKLETQNRPEEKYIKDIQIKDKNEFINNIKYIYRDISLSSEKIEYNCNFQYNNRDNPITKSELLYKFGLNSPLYQQSTLLYNNLLSNIKNDGKEIKDEKNKNINENVEMNNVNDNLDEKAINKRIININSICNELEKTLKIHRKKIKDREDEENKKKEEIRKKIEEEKRKKEEELKKKEDKNKMEIEKENTKIPKGVEREPVRKKVCVDNVDMIFEDEINCLEKLKMVENYF